VTQFGNNLPNFLIGSGVDTLQGNGDADSLVGSTTGRNLIFGNQGGDSLISQAGADTIYGGQGNDIIRSRGGSLLYGDRGNDTIVGEATSTGVIGGSSVGGGDTMYGGDGDDSLVANSVGPSSLFGNQGNDVLVAGNKADTLYGGKGNDTLTSTVGGLLYGDIGNDNIVLSGSGVAGATTVYGGTGDDTITGGGRTLLFGNEGKDVITGGAGDSVYGGKDDDSLSATGSGAFISGDLGNDVLRNTGANNTLAGGEGDDTILFDGGAAFSTASGGGGKNFLQILPTITGSGNVLIAGSLGDTLVGAGANTLQGGVGDDSLVSGGSNVTLVGGVGRDTFNVLAGGAVAGFNPGEGDTIISGTAPFTVIGGSTGLFLTGTPNRDTLIGGSANDTLEGLGNADILTGGGGADVFLFRGERFTNLVSTTFSDTTFQSPTQFGGTFNVEYKATFPGANVAGGGTLSTYSFAGGAGTVSGAGGTVGNVPYGAALTLTYGTTGGPGTANPPIFGSSVGTNAVLLPQSGYGYAVSGFDTITDFESGVDQIRLEAKLFTNGSVSLNANSPGVFESFNGAGTNFASASVNTSLLYDRTSGILYTRTANAPVQLAGTTAVSGGTSITSGTFLANSNQLGTQFIFSPTPSFLSGGLVNGTLATLASGTSAGTNLIGTVQYQLLPITPPSTVLFVGGNVSPSIGTNPPVTAGLPIPFAQVLKGNAPVTDLTYGRDIVIF